MNRVLWQIGMRYQMAKVYLNTMHPYVVGYLFNQELQRLVCSAIFQSNCHESLSKDVMAPTWPKSCKPNRHESLSKT